MSRSRFTQAGLLIVTAITAFLVGCHTGPVIDRSPTLATVNGERITEEDYRDYVRARDLQQLPLPHNAQSRKIILNELINRVILAQAARKAGLQRLPAVHVALKEDRENILARAMLKHFLATHRITHAALETLYRQELLHAPHEEYEARHILVATRAKALAILKKLHDGMRFSVLAHRYSLDSSSADQGGALGWFNAADVLPSFYRALVTMHTGEISPAPIKTRFGWHIIQLLGKRPYTPPSFAAVKTRLYRSLEQQEVDNMMATMRRKAAIHYLAVS
jgi:peptidyl-prolyl cis-trans isomerase C